MTGAQTLARDLQAGCVVSLEPCSLTYFNHQTMRGCDQAARELIASGEAAEITTPLGYTQLQLEAAEGCAKGN